MITFSIRDTIIGKNWKINEAQNLIPFEILCYFGIKSLVNALHILYFVSSIFAYCVATQLLVSRNTPQFSNPRWFYFRNGLERYDHDNATTADAAISLWTLSLRWHHERWNFVHGGITYRYRMSLIREVDDV